MSLQYLVRSLWLAAVLCCVVPSWAESVPAPFTESDPPYYLNPRPDTISAYLQLIDARDATAEKESLGFVIGFMSEIFRANPDRVDGWVSARAWSRNTQNALVHALALAGMRDAASLAMKTFNWSEREVGAVQPQLARLTSLAAVFPHTGNDLDMFWGAFFASGNKAHVERIFFSYDWRARNTQIDPADILMLADSMRTQPPSPTVVENIKRMRSRYDNPRAHAVLAAATALWGLGANTQQHDDVRDVVMAHLRKAPDDRVARVLARHIADASTRMIGRTPNVPVLLLTTADADFSHGPMRDFFNHNKLPKIDKVFGRSVPAFAALAAIVKSGEHLAYRVDMTDVNHKTQSYFGGFQGPQENGQASIQTTMVPLVPTSAEGPGLYEISLTISGTQTPVMRFRTMVYFEDE